MEASVASSGLPHSSWVISSDYILENDMDT